MKKILAVIMAIAMFLVSSQATLAFHFCHGEFESLAVVSGTSDSCCGGEDSECSKGSCCTDIIQQIDIDDFQVTENIYSFNNDCKGYASCLPVYILFQNILTDAALINLFQSDFSPPPLPDLLNDIISSICVLRV